MLIKDHTIQDIANGSMSSFKMFFDAFYPALCHFCDDYLKSEEAAADIAQEAMIEFWRNRDTHTSVKQAKVYLYSIGRNKSLNYLRHQKVEERYAADTDQDEAIELAYIEDEVFNVLHNAVEQLPERSRAIIQLALKGYGNTEIAEELDISVNTVKTLKKSAYSKLRDMLKGRVFELVILSIFLFG